MPSLATTGPPVPCARPRRWAWCAAALAAVACGGSAGPPSLLSQPSGSDHHYALHPGHGSAADLRRVLLLPFNVIPGLPVGVVGITDPIFEEIAVYLEAHNLRVDTADSETARSLWLECAGEAQQRSSGEPDWSATGRRFVRRLRERRVFDAVVVPTLLYRKVEIRRGRVEWDGVVRELRGLKAPIPRRFSRWRRPTVIAVSLHVIVLGESSDELFHGLGGLEILQEADDLRRSHRRVHFRIREDLFQEPDLLREGIAIAFDPYLSPPEKPAAPSPGL